MMMKLAAMMAPYTPNVTAAPDLATHLVWK
jgi:hypothetical protein